MFTWLSTRLRRNEKLEQAPQTQTEPVTVCDGTRRGHSQRPVHLVRIQNRRRNKVARASRKRNRV